MPWYPDDHGFKIRNGNFRIPGMYFFYLNSSANISGNFYYFSKTSSAVIMSSITNELNAVAQCACLAARGCGQSLRCGEMEAGRLRHWEGRSWSLVEVIAGLFRIYTSSAWKVFMLSYGKTHAQGSCLCPPVPSMKQISPSTASIKEDPCQCECSAEVYHPAAQNSSYWEHSGSKRWQMQNSLWTPGFCGDSAGLFPELPLTLKKCHQIFLFIHVGLN